MRQRGQGEGMEAYLAPNHSPSLDHPGQGFPRVGIIVAHLYSFNTLSTRPINGEGNNLLIFPLLQAAKGLILGKHFFVEGELDTEYTKAGCRRNPG